MRGTIGGLLLAVAVCACASAPSLQEAAPAGPVASGWLLTAAPPRQYLVRLDGEGPDGHADLKLTLRVESAERFRLAASDSLGRRLWSLDVSGTEGVWVGESADRSCRLRADRSFGLPAVRLDLPVSALPALLLGRLPVAPRAGGAAAPEGRFVGEDGRRWSAAGRAGRLERWTVSGDDWRPIAWWRALGRGGELVVREPPVVLRWILVAESPLAGPLGAIDRTSLLPECADALP